MLTLAYQYASIASSEHDLRAGDADLLTSSPTVTVVADSQNKAFRKQ